MKKIILSTLMVLAFISNSQAADKTGKTAVGLTGGKVFIVGGEKFNNEADGLWAYGGFVRHHLNANWGGDVSFTRQDYDKICSCTRSNIFDVMGFYRVKGAEDMTPVVGLGLGVVDNGKKQNLHLGVRARLGMEKLMRDNVSLGANIDYQAVTKMPGAKNGPRPGDIGTFTPKLEVTWYFGN